MGTPSNGEVPPHPVAPARVGAYRILRVLGEGGMGVVYEAEQTEPVRRRVALKLIRGDLATAEVATRFEAERQALAVMEHPNIAKVFDAGTTPSGQPYFVMEYVDGLELNEFADTHRLSIEDRIRLFITLCEAIQHAHQKGVVHRDLKPSNVLVTDPGGAPSPRVIDFGVAKAMGVKLTSETLATAHGALLGTPAYMSPEQAEGRGLDVDTRSDIYSLGVMLYQLLTGRLPVDPAELGTMPFLAQLMTGGTNPPTPSERVAGSEDGLAALAEARGTDPPSLRRALRGDLDWIVMKAIAPERERRYETVNGLALDLRRFLDNEPVLARPPSTRYRVEKFVRRNRAGVIGAGAAAVLLVAGVVATTLGMIRARRAETTARREAGTSREVTDFLVGLFGVSDPASARGSDVSAREVLDRGAAEVESRLSGQPAVQARMERAIANSYIGLGLYEQARPLLERSLEGLDAMGEEAELEDALTRRQLAFLLVQEADYDRSEALARQAMATFEKLLGAGSQPWTAAVNVLAFGRLRSNRGLDEVEKLLVDALPVARAALGGRSEDVGTMMDQLCDTYLRRENLAAADSTCRATLDLRREIFDGDHPNIVHTLTKVAGVDQSLGRFDDALADAREALDMGHRLYGEAHPEIAYALESLAGTYRAMGRPDQALPYAQETVDMRRQLLEPDNPEVAGALNMLGLALSDLGRLEEAIAAMTEALEVDRKAFGEIHPDVATVLGNIGTLEGQRGNDRRALELAVEALSVFRQVLGPGDPGLIIPINNVAFQSARQGQLDVADSLYFEARSIADRTRPDDDLLRLILETNHSRVLSDMGRASAAVELATHAHERLAATLGEDHWRTAVASTVLGRSLTLAGSPDQGEAALTGGWETLEESRPFGDVYRRDALQYMVELYESMARPGEAERYRALLRAESAGP